MKIAKLLLVICLSMGFTTGCGTSSESPEQLIRKPMYNEEKQKLEDAVKSLLNYSSFTLPGNASEVSKINEVDFNSDGINEVIAFEKKQTNDKSEVGFVILKNNLDETYTDKWSILVEGDSIEYGNFYDLNNDGSKEIILVVKEDNRFKLYVYGFENNEIKKLDTFNPTWIENMYQYTNLKVKIGYLNDDDIIDLLVISHNPNTNKAILSLVNYDKNLEMIDFIEFENVKNLSDLYITFGNVGKRNNDEIVKGVIIDIPKSNQNSYITQIVFTNAQNKLKKAFNEDNSEIIKAYYIPVDDINEDDILDIPIVNGNGHTYTSKSSASVSWNTWNGQEDESSNIVFQSQLYYNYVHNFKMLIPTRLVNKIEVEQEYQTDIEMYKFNYYNSIDIEPIQLFTISAVKKKMTEENKNLPNQTNILLSENENYTFLLTINDPEELNRLNIKKEKLSDYFSLIF